MKPNVSTASKNLIKGLVSMGEILTSKHATDSTLYIGPDVQAKALDVCTFSAFFFVLTRFLNDTQVYTYPDLSFLSFLLE